jgi:hypothetical protein
MILSRLVHLVRAGIGLATALSVLPAAGAESNACPLYPIALSTQTVAGLTVNAVVTNATFGARAGRFGWLTWAGSPSERALEASLTPPGNSRTYVNPFRRHDHVISIGDSIAGRPDLPNSRDLRNALKALTNLTLTVPVWDRIRDKSRDGQDDNCDEEHRHHHGCDDRCGDNRRGHDDHDGEGDRVTYRVAGFAAIRILRYDLAGPDRLMFQFFGLVACGAQNQAPTVQAGGDQTIVYPDPASLAGQVSDDGQPSGTVLTQAWMQVNGPGTSTFANSNALATAVSFSTTGVFTLRLTASDTALTASDDVVVTVNAPNRPPVAQDRSLVLAEDTTAAATLLASDPEGSALTYSVITPPNHGVLTGFPPLLVYVPLADFHGADVFTFKVSDGQLDSSNATVSIDITAVNDAPVADAIQLTNLEDTVLSVVLSGADVEGSNLTYAITTPPSFGSLGPLATNLITYTPAPDFSGEDVFTYVVADGDLFSSTARVTVLVLPVNDPPRADAGPDQLVDAGATNLLAGSGSDPENAVTCRWTVVSGPGPVAIANPAALATTVRMDEPGNYLLRLTVGDGVLSVSDDQQITVNGPPLVNAGPDQLLVTNQAVTLAGVVSDDGVPGALDLAWSQISGPGAALIASGQAAVAIARFTTPGDYTLRLSATDTRLVGQDDVRVSVRPAGPNQAPLVHAGSDQSLAYTDRAELRGRLFDDALPWGGARTLLWSVVSPPSAVVSFSCPTCEVTVATFMASGDYVLRLTASDSELASSDDVAISIQLDNLPPVVDAGPDQDVTGLFATLNGAASDDGQPAALSASWMVVSGPGAASIIDANHLGTRVAFSRPGTYVLRLTAADGAAVACDEVSLTVVGNRAPTAAAGPDQVLDLTVPPALAPPTYHAAPQALGWVADVAQPGWTNLTWGGNSYINPHGLVADGTRLFAACTVPYVNGVDVQGLGCWDGCTWSALRDPRIPENYWSASGFVTRANTYVLGHWSNRLYMAGSFHYDAAGGPDGVIGSYWDGAQWNAWPFPRLTYPVIGLNDLDGASNGLYVAGSDFSFYPTLTNGYPVGHRVGFWDGTHWLTLGEGITNGYLQTVRVAPKGDVYVGGAVYRLVRGWPGPQRRSLGWLELVGDGRRRLLVGNVCPDRPRHRGRGIQCLRRGLVQHRGWDSRRQCRALGRCGLAPAGRRLARHHDVRAEGVEWRSLWRGGRDGRRRRQSHRALGRESVARPGRRGEQRNRLRGLRAGGAAGWCLCGRRVSQCRRPDGPAHRALGLCCCADARWADQRAGVAVHHGRRHRGGERAGRSSLRPAAHRTVQRGWRGTGADQPVGRGCHRARPGRGLPTALPPGRTRCGGYGGRPLHARGARPDRIADGDGPCPRHGVVAGPGDRRWPARRGDGFLLVRPQSSVVRRLIHLQHLPCHGGHVQPDRHVCPGPRGQ